MNDIERGLIGSPIQGSRWLRAFCCACGEPMRVPKCKCEYGDIDIHEDSCEYLNKHCGRCLANLSPGQNYSVRYCWKTEDSPWQQNAVKILEDG